MNVHFQLLPEAVALADVSSKSGAIGELAALFSRVYGLDKTMLETRFCEREALGSTGFGRGVAIPHARVPDLKQPVAGIVKLAHPIDFAAADGIPVNLVFGLISPEQGGMAHLRALAAISRMMRDDSIKLSLLAASGKEELYRLLSNVIDRDAA